MVYSQPITQFDDEEQKKMRNSLREEQKAKETKDALEAISLYEEEKKQGKLKKLDSVAELFE